MLPGVCRLFVRNAPLLDSVQPIDDFANSFQLPTAVFNLNLYTSPSTLYFFGASFTGFGFLYGLLVTKWIYQAIRPKAMQPTSTKTRAMRRKGSAWRTAVAFGVKPIHLNASGPEKPCPIVYVEWRCRRWRCVNNGWLSARVWFRNVKVSTSNR